MLVPHFILLQFSTLSEYEIDGMECVDHFTMQSIINIFFQKLPFDIPISFVCGVCVCVYICRHPIFYCNNNNSKC